jgi:phosphoesterase RecJ-like protein
MGCANNNAFKYISTTEDIIISIKEENNQIVITKKSSSAIEIDILPLNTPIIHRTYENVKDVGMITDTGRFRYRGVSKRTHMMAGHLVGLGVDVEDIDKKLSSESLQMMSLKGYVYSNFKTTPGGFIYVTMPKSVYESFGVSSEEAASIVNMLGGIEGYPVWAIFIEYEAEIRVRIRSNGPNINELANQFEGGGHAKAAGARIHSWDDVSTFVKATELTIKQSLQ